VSELTFDLLVKFNAAMLESKDIELFGVRSYKGLMMLCEHGCGWDSYLILAGPMRGHVVEDLAAAGAPAGALAAGYGAHPDNALPTFFEWQDYWIERSMEDVESARLERR
jgi:hypothetical protein